MAKVHIDRKIIKQAADEAASGVEIDYRDKATSGMVIRVRGRVAAWYYMGEHGRKRIADLDRFTERSLEELRQLIREIRKAYASGEKDGIDTLIRRVVEDKVSVEVAKSEIQKVAAPVKEQTTTVWTWEEMRDAYLEHVEKALGYRSWEAQRSGLGATGKIVPLDFSGLSGKRVDTITTEDLEAVLEAMEKRFAAVKDKPLGYGFSQRVKTYQYIRTLFKWASDRKRRAMTGIDVNIGLLVDKPEKPSIDSGKDRNKRKKTRKAAVATFTERYASIPELARFGLGDLFNNDVIGAPQAKIALLLQLMTGQRISSVLSAFHIEFVRVPTSLNRPWKYVWALGPDKMGAYRLLPLPDVASWCVWRMKAKYAKDGNDFLFPQLKRRRDKNGVMSDGDWHLSYTAAKKALHRARNLEDSPLPKSFKGTHDSRRCFISHLSEWKTLGFDDHMSVERITHANEGKETVRQKVYDTNPALADKFRVLKKWEDMFFDAMSSGESDRDIQNSFEFYDNEDRVLDEISHAEYWAKMDAAKARMNLADEYDEDE